MLKDIDKVEKIAFYYYYYYFREFQVMVSGLNNSYLLSIIL